MVHVYKQPHPVMNWMHFVFVAMPTAAIVICGVYAVFFIIDILKWLKNAVAVVMLALSGKTKRVTSIVRDAGLNNQEAV
jgi:hypothetical protein